MKAMRLPFVVALILGTAKSKHPFQLTLFYLEFR
jgi:hypothetical protein